MIRDEKIHAGRSTCVEVMWGGTGACNPTFVDITTRGLI